MKFTKRVLGNGLRVVTVPMTDNPAVTVLVMVEAGSKYETKETNGISHFLEHMVFKGTPSRPQASDIFRELDSLGAEYNAFTGDEYTGYYAKVDKRHYDKALEIVSDMYLNPLFSADEIEKEKGVIIEEIRMYKDRPERQVQDALGALLYADQPAGWTITGPEENIRSFNRNHFVEYRKKHYVASATVVVVAGGINESEVFEKVEHIFGKVPVYPKEGKLPVKEFQDHPTVRVLHKDTKQTHLVMGIRTFSMFDEQRFVAKVLSGVLGGGMSSRLFSKMRDELGVCYYIHAGQQAWTDHGILSVSAGVDTTRVELAITAILVELNRLKTELVGDDELKKVKDSIIGRMFLGLETSDSQADYVAHDELFQKEIESPEEWLEEIQKVTPQQIQALAQNYFVDERLNMAIIGPYTDPKQFDATLTFKNK